MQEPIPAADYGRFEPTDDYVDVVYTYVYRCKICGWSPDSSFGCNPKMVAHLEEKHNIHPSEGKVFWISGYYDGKVKEALRLMNT